MSMSISGPFIVRPVATTLVMLAIILFGVIGYRLLPVSDLPNVDFPTILVSASLPGATPETMASALATPLERQFTTIAGLDSMTSASGTGSTTITLQFNLSKNIDAAAQDVQAAISAVQRQLPPEMPSPPTYQKVNPADQPVLYMALTSPTLPLSTLDEYGETFIAQRISTVPGVAQVQVFGSQKYAVRIQLDPSELASRGIGVDEVVQAVENANVNLPTGELYGPDRAYEVKVEGQIMKAALYEPLIIAYRDGRPVRLSDVGRALDDVENNKIAAWFGKDRALILAVQRQPGSNTVEVVRLIRDLLPTIKRQLPASVSLVIMHDRSESILASVNDVKFTLMLTLCLVVMVIFLFLRNFSATAIPSLALPMSIVGTFAAMYVLGFTLDNLSMMALTLSVGFVVDDAIVMLENIVRHLEMGEKPLEAALSGAKEIGFTILSMTLSLAAVFIPVLFLGGIVGRLFREFAVTIAVAILISGFVSLTLTPMLSARFLRPAAGRKQSALFRASERVFDAAKNFYAWTLRGSLHFSRSTMVVFAFTLVATVYLFGVVPKGFLPSEDRSFIIAFTEAAEGISYLSLFDHQKAVASVLDNDPNVQYYMSTTAARTGVSTNTGILFVGLVPRNKRAVTADQYVDTLRAKTAGVTGVTVYPQNPPTISVGGRLSQSQYQFTLQSPDTDELYRYALILRDKVRQLPGFVDVSTDVKIKNPQARLDIDRDEASALGVSAGQIEDALYTAYGSRQVSTIYGATNTYQVIMELLPQYQIDPATLSLLFVRGAGAQLVPLDAIASIKEDVGPLSINHSGQLPSATISFNLKPGVSLGPAVAQVEKIARDTLPATITTSLQGTAQAFESSMQGLSILLVLAIVVIYIVLGVLYESFLHPLTILSGLPSAGFGALLTLLVFRTDLNLYAFVGVILLVGLVKKNGIMMIDFALEAQRRENKAARDAIYDACLIRFRPIMMTTMSALMAGLPIALGTGAGSESRRPLGLAIVGGLLFSQLLTLYITPVFYLYMERFSAWLRRAPAETAVTSEPAAVK